MIKCNTGNLIQKAVKAFLFSISSILSGPEVSADDIQYMVRKLSGLTSDDYLVLAGMVPPSLPHDIYSIFFEALKENSQPKVIVDAPADQFKYILKYRPFLIKPNINELKEYVNMQFNNGQDVLNACYKLQEEGARNILVSIGKYGAVFLDEDGNATRIAAPGGEMIDRTGAGDSMISGFLADYIVNHNLKSSAMMAVATGSATATTDGIAIRDTVDELRKQMTDGASFDEPIV
ncbi:1-phosphofructokinase family hexose kinase [Anaerobiospirillum succiniciproducens]|uniref:1-phosphofructokinase family hexose kinase n=1 Tax=Anaerobiospirillum succiniciproducens TaxID=13335 RepID=UPI003F8A6511